MGAKSKLLKLLGLRGRKTGAGGKDASFLSQEIQKQRALARAFDPNFYLTTYHDVARSDMDPLVHFLEIGWREGRDPAPWFSTLGYLLAYGDIAASGVNPFLHYVMCGKAEGRAAAPDRDFGTPWLDDMVIYPERPVAPKDETYDPGRLRIHWVIPDFLLGAGGHMNIFRSVHWLERFGHVCKIWINRPSVHRDARHARADIARAFLPLRAQIAELSADFFAAEGDAVFATSFETVWPVSHATGFKERFYFVQDYEPSFFPQGSQSVAAEASYKRDLACICAGPWLKGIMKNKYGRWAWSYWYAYDPDMYRVLEGGDARGAVPRIAIYARQLTSRRLVELILCALTELARRKLPFHADLFGSHSAFTSLPFSATNHGILDEASLARLYNACDIGISLSATNYSLLDKEMMACGLPLIEFDGDNTRAIFPPDVITFAGADPAALADAVEGLIRNPGDRRAQAEKALTWVRRFNWEASARAIEKAVLVRIMSRRRWSASAPIDSAPRIASGAADPRDPGARIGPIIFVGQPEYYRSVYYDAVCGGRHFEFPISSGSPAARLQLLPDFVRRNAGRCCIVFRPEWLAGCDGLSEELQSAGVRVIGFSTEPVPTGNGPAHPDQKLRLEQLRRALSVPLDLFVHYDPASEEFLRELGFRNLVCHPLPVSKGLFFPEQIPVEFDACFLGKSTPHREHLLAPLKRDMRVVHIAHGLVDEHARKQMNRSRVVLNLHNEAYPNFENRAVQALRCGRPLVSERLSGPWLKPGRDYHLAETPDAIFSVVRALIAGDGPTLGQADLSRFDLDVILEEIAVELETKHAKRRL